MSYSPILIVGGEPDSIFFEIFFKSLKKIKIKSPLILVASEKYLKLQMKKFKYKREIKIINSLNLQKQKLNNKYLNLMNVEYKMDKKSKTTYYKSKKRYIKKCFEVAFKLIKNNNYKKFINGPVNKSTFLNKNFLGLTEYISSKFKIKKNAMLIYNKNLSVCPLTTHLPIQKVSKSIEKKKIIEKIKLIDAFYKKMLKCKPNIGVLGLNPHCESISNFNEDEKIIAPVIKSLSKKKYKISGPYPADTMFLKQNRRKFNVILGMYHDQVLTPLKTLCEYDAINITLGLPFLRVSPDHGPNERMVGKNKSNPLSLMRAISFLDKN